MTDRRPDGSFDITGSSAHEQSAAGVTQFDNIHVANEKVLKSRQLPNPVVVHHHPTGAKLDAAVSKLLLWGLLIPAGSIVILAALAYALHATVLGLVQSHEVGRHPRGIATMAAHSVLNGQTLQRPDAYLSSAQIARAPDAGALLKAMDGHKVPEFRFGLDPAEPVRVAAYLCAFNERCRAVVDQHGKQSLDQVLRLAQQFLLLQVVKGRGGPQAVQDYCFFPLVIEPRVHNVGNARNQCASLVAVLKPPGLAVGQRALSAMDTSPWQWMSRGLALGSEIYGLGHFHF